MKKIFISVLMLSIIGFAAPSFSRWGENFSRTNPNGNGSFFSSDSDGYWLNKFRNYKKYPINFYSQRLLNKGSSENTQEVEVHEYQRNVAVTARLGQRMYDSTTYTVTTKVGGEEYIATSDGVLYRAQDEIKIKKGQIFVPFGEVKINGQYYILFDLPDSSYVAAVDYNGHFLDGLGLVEQDNLYISKDITIVRPHDLHVEPYKDVEETTGDTTLHFAVKFDGIQGNNMAFIISNNDDPEYDQRKFAPLGEQVIQINGINFRIIHVSPDYIEYMILENPTPQNNPENNPIQDSAE